MNVTHRRVLTLGEYQHGVFTRAQARRVGLTDGQVDSWLRNRLVIPVAPHAYRVRGAPQSVAMAIAAGVLGGGGVASHATAASLLRLDVPLPLSPIHVTVDVARAHPRLHRVNVEAGDHAFFRVAVHRYRAVDEPRPTIDGVPCTDAARALIDTAGRLAAEDLETAFERARRLRLVSTEVLARRFGQVGGRGRPGTAKIRELLANAEPRPLDSRLEVKAWRMLKRSRLRTPHRQVRIDVAPRRYYRLDFAWPDLRVAFETEGFEWHGSRAQWKQDRIRTAALERLGWRIVVGTWDDVVREPRHTLERIAAALGERRALKWSA